LLRVVNVRVKYAGERELAAAVDRPISGCVDRDVASLTHSDDTILIDYNSTVSDDPALGIHRNEIVEVTNDGTRHGE
jgi:hypothetical protein